MPSATESPQARWDRENTRVFRLKVMRTTEADILQKLESESNVSGYIKRLIRADILQGDTAHTRGNEPR